MTSAETANAVISYLWKRLSTPKIFTFQSSFSYHPDFTTTTMSHVC